MSELKISVQPNGKVRKAERRDGSQTRGAVSYYEPSRRRIPWQSVPLSDVWERLGGPPITWRGDRARTRAFWRDGNGLNVSLDREKNVFYDFSSGEGGGILRLAELVLGNRHAAGEWFARNFGEDETPYDPRAADERRQLREYARLWRASRIRQLERIKAHAFEDMMGPDPHRIEQQWWMFTEAARELFHVQKLAGAALVEAFETAVGNDPEYATRLVLDQEEDEEHALDVTAFIVACVEFSAMDPVERYAN